MKAHAVIANPKQLELRRGRLEPIPVAAEEQRALEFLAAASGADAVYLICHGAVQDGVPRLLLEKEAQPLAAARGDIARRFSDCWMPVLFMRSKDGPVWTAEALAPGQRAASA